jgi:integrase
MSQSIITKIAARRKRVRITKPTGRKPMRLGALLLKEVSYKDEWRIQATWRDPARRKRWFNNWRAAEEFAQKENKRLDVIKERGAGRFTFNDAADSYLKRCEQRVHAKNRDLTPDSLFAYQRDVENLEPKFGHLRLETITTQDVEDWLIEQRTKFSDHTTSRWLIRLRSILDHAVDRGMLHANPLRVKKIKQLNKYKKRVDIPDRSDLEVLRKFLNQPRPVKNGTLKWSCLRVLVLLGASCGMRAGEVAGLRWDSIDPVTGEIDIKESIAPRAGRKGPKTEAGYRKVPTTPRARDIINEHAELYKQQEGKCVGSVLKTRDMEYLRPHMVSAWFTEVMLEAGLVRPGTKKQPKFTFHALRHWCASHWMKTTGDVHQVAKWLGHKNASMTLDIYGHCLDDSEAREKFERMPDWLNPIVEIDAPLQRRPIQITEPLALPAPTEPALEFNSVEQVERGFHVDVPDIAKPWLKPFIQMLADGISVREAYRLITPQVPPSVMPTGGIRKPRISAQAHVIAELKRLNMPTPKEIAARVRDERILKLHAEKYQAGDIARMMKCGRSVVFRALKSRHKENAHNPLNYNLKPGAAKKAKAQTEHKSQLKLL